MTNPLMTYISSAQPQASGARKYTGSVATGYDAKRVESPKWAAEQEIIESIIDLFDNGSVVLDVPCGTGRFIAACERNEHHYCGVDRSADMIKEAWKKVTWPDRCEFYEGDITALDQLVFMAEVESMKAFEEQSADLSIACRITRWLSPEQRTQALHQLQRVTKNVIVFTARVANHPYAYPLEDIKEALCDGWKIARDIECGEPYYRVVVLERAE